MSDTQPKQGTKPKNNACLPNIKDLIAAGIDPKTGLPLNLIRSVLSGNKGAIKTLLQIRDKQDAITRYEFDKDNIPFNLSSQEIEKMIYYKNDLCMFYYEDTDEYFLLPYALNGTIDMYQRYNFITPVPMGEGQEGLSREHKRQASRQKKLLSQLKLRVVYSVDGINEIPEEERKNCAIVIHDIAHGLSQKGTARAALQEPLLDIMADCIPFMRTSLLNSTGVEGVRVKTQDEYSNVLAASIAIDNAARNGEKFVPIVGGVDFQEMTGQNAGRAADFMQAMQSLDNFRLSLYGKKNGGVFQKKEHMLEDEQNMNKGGCDSPLEEGLKIREHFCELANALWGLDMSVKISESAQANDPDTDEELNDETGGEDDGRYE